MPLTELAVRNAKPADRLIKLSDGGGLQLWIERDGAKRWRLAYRVAGRQKLFAIGVYPEVGLKEARKAREAAKKVLAVGGDPMVVKKEAKEERANAAANTFQVIAAELVEKKRSEEKAAQTISKTEWLLSLAYPGIGARPIKEIEAPDILRVCQAVAARGRFETAKRLRATIGQVFRYAVVTGRAIDDPTGALKGALAAPPAKHRAAIVKPASFGALLRAISEYEGAPETRNALQLLALTFVRPGELRSSEWSEFDLHRAVWSIPGEKMKMHRPHQVPLAPQALAILRDLRAITGKGRFVFPSARTADRCMSENTINAALRRLGFKQDEMSAHGFRSAASSLLNESGKWNADAIERQLAHVDTNSVRRAYARGDYWSERVQMMTWWGGTCDSLRNAGA
jgi:integrase